MNDVRLKAIECALQLTRSAHIAEADALIAEARKIENYLLGRDFMSGAATITTGGGNAGHGGMGGAN